MGPLKYGASPGVYTRDAGSIPGGSIFILLRQNILYCMMRARQGESSAFGRLFCKTLWAASRNCSVAHFERDCLHNRDACSNSLLTSGNTRTCSTSRLAASSLGLPLFAMRKVYCKKILESRIFLFDLPIKVQYNNSSVVTEG